MEIDGGLEKLTKMSDFLSHSEFVCKSKTYILYIFKQQQVWQYRLQINIY